MLIVEQGQGKKRTHPDSYIGRNFVIIKPIKSIQKESDLYESPNNNIAKLYISLPGRKKLGVHFLTKGSWSPNCFLFHGKRIPLTNRIFETDIAFLAWNKQIEL